MHAWMVRAKGGQSRRKVGMAWGALARGWLEGGY